MSSPVKIMNYIKNYAKCITCKKPIQYNQAILKTSASGKSAMHMASTNMNVCIICTHCFNDNDFIEIDADDEVHKNAATQSQLPPVLGCTLMCDLQIYLHDNIMYFSKKDLRRHKKSSNILFQKEERKAKLIIKLKELKLENTKDKLCEEYVNFGNPDLDTVTKTLLNKQNMENDRLCTLLEFLKKHNLEYSNKIPSYKKYIKKGGNINKIVENGELEKVLILDTNYLSMLDLTDSDTAREIALCNVNKKNTLTEKYILKKNTLIFD